MKRKGFWLILAVGAVLSAATSGMLSCFLLTEGKIEQQIPELIIAFVAGAVVWSIFIVTVLVLGELRKDQSSNQCRTGGAKSLDADDKNRQC